MLTIYRPTFPGVRRDYWPAPRSFDYFPEQFSESALFPRVEMKFEGGVYKILAEVPGIDRGDIHIDVEGNTLFLRGEKKAEFDEETGRCQCSERYYGSFERSFDLPSDAHAEGIEAHLDKGVLTISVPIAQEGQGKKIEIEVH